jgi:hypothetical protein
MVVGSYFVLRGLYHDQPFVRVGVPTFLAFFPQDVFFGVSPDSLSAFAGGVSFVGLAWLAAGRLRAPAGFALTGLAVSVAFLIKYTNAVYLVLAGLASVLLSRGGRGGAPARSPARPLAAFWVTALVPIALWFGRNAMVLGDMTGTRRKMDQLEWAPKALSEIFQHPLFTPSGALGFLIELPTLFWRGEFLWHGQEMSFAWLDAFYAASSLVLVLLAAWGVWRGRRRDIGERWASLRVCELGEPQPGPPLLRRGAADPGRTAPLRPALRPRPAAGLRTTARARAKVRSLVRPRAVADGRHGLRDRLERARLPESLQLVQRLIPGWAAGFIRRHWRLPRQTTHRLRHHPDSSNRRSSSGCSSSKSRASSATRRANAGRPIDVRIWTSMT